MIFLLTAESEFAVGWKPRASDSALILADMNPCEWADPTHSLISVHTSALRPTARTCRPLAINNFVFVIVGLSARFWAGHVIINRQSPFCSVLAPGCIVSEELDDSAASSSLFSSLYPH